MVSHTKVLNTLLMNACPEGIKGEEHRFMFDLCCATATIVAHYNLDGTYDIVSYTIT